MTSFFRFQMRTSSFRERLGVYFQLLICIISWFRYIDMYSDDIIITEVKMIIKIQTLLNREINQNGGVW